MIDILEKKYFNYPLWLICLVILDIVIYSYVLFYPKPIFSCVYNSIDFPYEERIFNETGSCPEMKEQSPCGFKEDIPITCKFYLNHYWRLIK